MNIDFSAVDRAVERVIAKHEAMFKFEMAMKRLERENWPFPANFALAASTSAAIVGEYNARIRAAAPTSPRVTSITLGEYSGRIHNLIENAIQAGKA